MYDVVIVEDDPMIAMLDRKFIENDPRFKVVASFSSGHTALRRLLSQPADLVILDVYMPVLTGTELLRELRAYGSDIDVIMVTAAHDTQTVNELLKLGIADYLVKPFTAGRFQQALDTFARSRELLTEQKRISQSQIDRLLGLPSDNEIPKGLQSKTSEKILEELKNAPGELTSEELSSMTGLSAVTVRRYLNYLLDIHEAESRVNYDTGGRPAVLYKKVNKNHND